MNVQVANYTRSQQRALQLMRSTCNKLRQEKVNLESQKANLEHQNQNLEMQKNALEQQFIASGMFQMLSSPSPSKSLTFCL